MDGTTDTEPCGSLPSCVGERADCLRGWLFCRFYERGDCVELRRVNVNRIIPYENNPRKNDDAVKAVAESIKQCEYVAPIIVDENMVILAGHTRLKALKSLNITECDVIVKGGLSDEQKRKYRILDNKTNEFAEWDMDALIEELEGLDFEGCMAYR